MRGATALALALVGWISVFVVGLESTWVGVLALAASVAAVVLGIVVARRTEPRSADALLGIAGAALAGLLFLYAAIVIAASLLGWLEWR